jgi:hypothetical protein
MARTHAIALLGAASVLLGACGSSARPIHSSASPAPKFVTAGDAICTRELAKLNRLPQPSTPGQAVSYLPQALRIMQRETSELAALERPAAQRAQLAASIERTSELAALLRGFLHELRSGIVEISTFARVQTQSDALRAEADASFRQAGLTACAQ